MSEDRRIEIEAALIDDYGLAYEDLQTLTDAELLDVYEQHLPFTPVANRSSHEDQGQSNQLDVLHQSNG